MNKITIILVIIIAFVVTGCGSTLTQNRIKDSQTSIMHTAPYSGPEPSSPICDEQRKQAMNYLTCFDTPLKQVSEVESAPASQQVLAPVAPEEEMKPETGSSDIEKRINKRSEALNKCKDAGENNAALRLEQGKDHTRLYRLLADEGDRATQLDRAFINFLQSIRDMPSEEAYCFLAYTQKEKGWVGKANPFRLACFLKGGTWEQLEEWIKAELDKKPVLKAEKMTIIKAASSKKKPSSPEKKAEKQPSPEEKVDSPKTVNPSLTEMRKELRIE